MSTTPQFPTMGLELQPRICALVLLQMKCIGVFVVGLGFFLVSVRVCIDFYGGNAS